MTAPGAIDAAVEAATAVIPVDPDDGTCIVAYQPDGIPLWGMPQSLANVIVHAAAPVLLAAERERIAARIEAELVCCNIYRRIEDAYKDARDATGGHEEGVAAQRSVMRSSDYHAICHWGGYAAAIARGSVAGKPAGGSS